LVVHFNHEIFKSTLAVLPEMQGINQLLFDSQFGIKFTGTARTNIEVLMKGIIRTKGIAKLIKLIDLLGVMSKTEEKQL
jgi:hypothetical protein